jgi:hypothetical protein
MPAIARLAAVVLASAHEAPARVMVTTVLVVDPVAVHELNPPPVLTLGVAGMVKPAGKLAVTVAPVASDPLAEVEKATVQVVAVAPATWLEPVKATELTAVEAEAGPTMAARPAKTTTRATTARAATAQKAGAWRRRAPSGRGCPSGVPRPSGAGGTGAPRPSDVRSDRP